MKKLLLTVALACGLSAAAAPVTLNVGDATAIVGTDVPETPAQGTNNGQARHIQPLESLTIGDYNFTFAQGEASNAPAYYYAMSTNENGTKTIRLYSKSSMTITAPAGVKMAKIEMTGSSGTKNSSNTASVGTVEAPSASSLVWTYAAGAETLTITAGANFRITTLTITPTGEGVVDPQPAENYTFNKVTTVANGDEILLVADGKANVEFTKSYGYMSAEAVTIADNAFTALSDGAIKLVAVEGGYNMVTAGGKYLGAKTGYNTFDTTDDSADNRVWTIAFDADGNATITNVATSKVVAQDPGYGSFGCYDAVGTYNLPAVYKKGEASTVDPVNPQPTPTGDKFVKANAATDGMKFVFVAGGKANTDFTKNYGYMSASDVTIADDAFYGEAGNALTLTAVEGGYNITTAAGKFLGAKEGYKTFDTTDDSSANRVWTITFNTDGTATVENVATGLTVYQDPSYSSFGCYGADAVQDTYVKPFIYVLEDAAGISAVEAANENAPVEYYNLQGIRVAEPANGLYIRRQGNTASKVYIR